PGRAQSHDAGADDECSLHAVQRDRFHVVSQARAVESSPPAATSKESSVPDEIDLALLRLLQRSGRMPFSELATRVGIAESTCHKRVRALVASGAISGFHATVDPAVLGLHLEALISIRLHSHARA